MITSIESQQEYVRAQQSGYGYTHHGDDHRGSISSWAHYYFRTDQVEPDVRRGFEARFGAPHAGYVWSLRNATLGTATPDTDLIITPLSYEQALNWVDHARSAVARFHREHA